MYDRSLPLHHVLATVIWCLAIGFIVAGLASRFIYLGHLGLLFTACAAVLNIRGFICCATQQVLDNERNAFELGRDSAEVRSLRR